jgi:tRNA(Ile2) C34 agmatinyltransferase TiaS
MRVYLGFDDTDTTESSYGTGKLVRWFQDALPEGCRAQGVVRQQLLVCDDIPYTSHNSSACLIADIPEAALLDGIIARAVEHLHRHAQDGSDPGLCVAFENGRSLAPLIEFGHQCTCIVNTQQDALRAASGFHLSGHGGTNDGIIGAAAAVGLTASGWSGRFIDYGDLRRYPDTAPIRMLRQENIEVVSVERDAHVPAPDDVVITKGWVRPRLLGHRAVLLVQPKESGVWENIHQKRRTKNGNSEEPS